jgi:L1 cell adhesion molecule like protein
LSLGLETVGGVFAKIIERNTSIPCKKTESFTTDADNQTCVEILVYEGERYKTKDNNLLGKFDLDGIAPAPRGVPQIEVTYELDANGILHVVARDKASARKNNITINNDKGRLSQSEIDRMIAEAEKYKDQDNAQAEKIKAKQELENYCHQILDTLDNKSLMVKLTDDEQEKIETICTEGLEWVEHNDQLDKAAFATKQKQLETELKPLMLKMYQSAAEGESGGAKAKAGRKGKAGSGRRR